VTTRPAPFDVGIVDTMIGFPTDPEQVFLEVANEPGLDNPQDWYTVETRCIAAMRAAAPRHTIVAGYNMKSGPKEWNALKALTLFPEIADKNVIYNFHDYNPMALTHQGASWSKGANRILKGVLYPSNPEVIAPLIGQYEDPAARKMLQQYGEARWNREKMEKELAIVADWAKARGVCVTCNEFGVHRPVAPPESRAAWTRDMRLTFEKYGIGWTIWDGSFSFLSGRRGQLTVDEPIIKALGLQIPLRYSSRIIPH
jgi:endoglucanase